MCHYGNIISFRSYQKHALQSNLMTASCLGVHEETDVVTGCCISWVCHSAPADDRALGSSLHTAPHPAPTLHLTASTCQTHCCSVREATSVTAETWILYVTKVSNRNRQYYFHSWEDRVCE